MTAAAMARITPKEPDRIVAKIFATPGLRSKIADACGIRYQTVMQWKRVPPHWVHIVSEVTGMSPEQIRPDIFARNR